MAGSFRFQDALLGVVLGYSKTERPAEQDRGRATALA